MSYTVTAPVVVVRVEQGGPVYVYKDGVLPAGADKEHIEQLLAEEMIEKTRAPKAAKADPDPAKEPTIEEILNDVGDDKAKAAEALEAEKAGKNRSTLVPKLEAIVSAS